MQVTTSLLDSVFTLEKGSRLAIDYSNSKIFVWNRSAGAMPATTSRLSPIVYKVKNFMDQTPIETLPTNHLFNLSHNVHVVNRALESYNARLTSYCFFNIVDKVLKVVTFDRCRLIYKPIQEGSLCVTVQKRLAQASESQFNLLAALPAISKYNIESGKFIPVSLEPSFKSFTQALLLQFPQLESEKRTEALVLADRFKCWNSSLGVYIQAFQSIVSTPKDKFGNLKSIFLERLCGLSYGEEVLAHSKELADLVIFAVFNEPQRFKNNTLPTFVYQMVSTLSAVELISDHYDEVLKLTLTILYWEACKSMPGRPGAVMSRLFQDGIELDFRKISPQHRLQFLQKFSRLSMCEDSDLYELIKASVYKACHAIHAQLVDEEKAVFYPMVIQGREIDKQPYPVIFGVARYYSDPKLALLYGILRDLLDKISRYEPEMNKNELSAVLGIMELARLKGFMNSNSREVLGERFTLRVMNRFVVKFMQEIAETEGLISTQNKVMLELCLWASREKITWPSEEDPSKKNREVIKKILQQINFSQIHSTPAATTVMFGNHPLSQIFQKDPDRYISTANEEQLEVYYGPKEKNLKVNIDHLSISIGKAVEVPPLPAGVEAKIDECLTMFDQINFTQANKPDYVDPRRLKDDDDSISVESLKGGLRQLIGSMRAQTLAFAPRDPREKEKFYRDMTLYLLHSIVVLRGRPAGDRSAYLIPLAAAGIHCGSKTFETMQDMYYKLTGAKQIIDGDTLEGGLIKLLAARRTEILKSETLKILQKKYGAERHGWQINVHILGQVFKTVGKRFNVSEAEAHQFQDGYRGVLDFQSQADQDALYENCLKAYTSTVIINEIYQHIEGIAGHPRTIKLEFRELINTWYKDEIVKDSKGYFSKEKNPELILSEDVYHPQTFRIKRAQLIYLLERVGHVLTKSTWRNLWGWSGL